MFTNEILRVPVPSFNSATLPEAFISDDSNLWNREESVLRLCSWQGVRTCNPVETDPLCFRYPLASQVPDCLSCQYNFGLVSSCTLHFLNLAFITVWKAGFDKNQFPNVICATWTLGMGKMPFLGSEKYFCNSRAEWRFESQRHFDNRVWPVFNQIKVELVANMKVWKYLVLTHSMVRIHPVNSLFRWFHRESCCFFGLKKKKKASSSTEAPFWYIPSFSSCILAP